MMFPTSPLAVDYDNPIANGLAFCIPCVQVGTLTDLVTGNTAATPSGWTTDPSGNYGGGCFVPGTDTTGTNFGVWQPIKLGDNTLLVLWNPPETSGSNAAIMQWSGTNGNPFISLIGNIDYRTDTISSGGLSLDITDGTSKFGAFIDPVNHVVCDGNYHVHASRVFGSVNSLWVDGVNLTSGFDTGTNYIGGTQKFCIGNLPDGVGSMPATCTIVMVMGWNRALSNSEMASIGANPFQILMTYNDLTAGGRIPIHRPFATRAAGQAFGYGWDSF